MVRKLKNSRTLASKEAAYRQRLDRQSTSQPGGDIDLFI
jgi:chemotaxis protein CheD